MAIGRRLRARLAGASSSLALLISRRGSFHDDPTALAPPRWDPPLGRASEAIATPDDDLERKRVIEESSTP